MLPFPHEVEIPHHNHQFKNLPKTFFYHTIDVEAKTLSVEVFGPNLSFTFKHSGAKDLYHATELGSSLSRKTVGYSTLVPNVDERIVLAWAESGHGLSRAGEMLDGTPFALVNASWTRRAMAVMSLLGIKTGSMFDNPHGKHAKDAEQRRGIFSGSHVEVKLATHAVFFLLRQFNITKDLDSVTKQHLLQLREVKRANPKLAAFEIHFSREPCRKCEEFVRRLQQLTQVELRLQWHKRLVTIKYDQRDNGVNPNGDMRYPQDDTVSVCSEVESVATLPAEVEIMADSAMAEPTRYTDVSPPNIQDDDVLYVRCNARSVTPAIVIDLTKEPKEPAPHEAIDGDVDKPLPATAELNEPSWMVSLRRSPRPYCSSVLGHGCTCGMSCSKCVKH